MEIEELVGGGAPLLGEPLAVELANATFTVRSREVDGLRTVAQLAAWLRDNRDRFGTRLSDEDLRGVSAGDLDQARALRAAIRALASASVRGGTPPADAVEEINRLVRQAPGWHELVWAGEPYRTERTTASVQAAALGELAASAVELFAGPRRDRLRACQAPGCVLFFVKDHARREWCSPVCGNRVRAARHYERHRKTSEPPGVEHQGGRQIST
ncbi:MAG: ABATE domain-containing protein, partial [Streptosporangiaceae bacterium]